MTGVGLYGVGWMGAEHVKRLAAEDKASLLRVYDPERRRGEERLRELGLSPDLLTTREEDLLADPRVEAVWVASPNAHHGRQSIEALRAGKHVFCEKPAATTFGEYRDQIDEDDRRPDQVTLVDYLLMFDPLERRLFSMVESALFGEIAQIQVNYRHPVNISGSKAWKLNRNQIGDAIGMGIVHSLFIMVHVMGLQNQRPARVHAVSQSARVRPFEVDPLWTITVEFDGGAVGVCQGNIDFGNGYDSYHNVSGTHGGFVFDAQLPASTRLRYWSEKKTRGQWIFPLDAADCESKGLADLSWPADMQMPDSGDVLHHQVASVDSYFLEHVQNRRKCALGFAATQDVGDVWWGAILSAYRDRPVDMPLDRGADAEIGRAMSGE